MSGFVDTDGTVRTETDLNDFCVAGRLDIVVKSCKVHVPSLPKVGLVKLSESENETVFKYLIGQNLNTKILYKLQTRQLTSKSFDL